MLFVTERGKGLRAMRQPSSNAMRRREAEKAAAFVQERRRQLRGLLVLAGAVLLLVLWRAHARGVFHTGWWRI
jgi:hypothetical protein